MNNNYKLINKDVIEGLAEVPNRSIEFIFADPPYFLSNDGFTVKSGKAVSVNKGGWDKSKGFKEDVEFHTNWITASLEKLTDDGSIAISGTYHSIYICGYVLQSLGCRVINEIVWFKPNGAPALAGRNFTASHETIIWASKNKSAKHTFNYAISKNWEVKNDLIYRQGKQMRSVWSIPSTPKREKSFGNHPTQKPLELLNRMVSMCTNESDTILDPFCGSGTSGVASISQKRNFIGIDLDNTFIEITRKRIEAINEDNSTNS